MGTAPLPPLESSSLLTSSTIAGVPPAAAGRRGAAGAGVSSTSLPVSLPLSSLSHSSSSPFSGSSSASSSSYVSTSSARPALEQHQSQDMANSAEHLFVRLFGKFWLGPVTGSPRGS